MDNVSYALGLGIGSQLKSMGAESLNIDDFAQAIKDVLNDSELKISMADSQKIVQKFFQEQEAKQRAAMAETGKKLKAEGEAYLAENAKKDGVITTASGLQYTVLKEGTGKSPKATDTVVCHYEGFLTNGTVFDSSIQRGEPAAFPIPSSSSSKKAPPKKPSSATRSKTRKTKTPPKLTLILKPNGTMKNSQASKSTV